MNGPPPDWDQAPPAGHGDYGRGGGGGQQRRQQNKMTDAQAKHAAEAFFTWLADKATLAQLRMMLPDHVDPHVFIATCKTAVLTKPQLLREDLRPSLMTAVMKAAGQGLRPDGKEGALVPRYDTEAKSYTIAWQPMVWGLTKLGRETGAVKSIRAVIVYRGEPFEIIQGEEDTIRHTVDIDIEEEAFTALHSGFDQWGNPKANADAYFEFVRAAYCVITGVDGTVTKRWMTRKRLQTLRDAAKAKNGPWSSVFLPEMICKSVILFTAKWINLDPDSASAKRFQSAIMTDMDADLDRHDEVAIAGKAPPPALEAPGTKLDAFEATFARRREAMPVEDPAPRVTTERQVPAAQEQAEHQAPENAPLEAKPAGEPPVDGTMATWVDMAVTHFGGLSPDQAYEEVQTDRYRNLVRQLTNAGQLALLKRLTDAVDAAQRGRQHDRD